MRLLRNGDDGDLCLVEYMDEKEIPPYAILSHRWGTDSEEVTLKDILEVTGKNKIGYDKIRACGEQAALDGLKLFWVDTCCIDKTSSAELSEAINSMWRWYRNSRVCYAYLNDVPANTNAATRDNAMAESKWFTRGWTLQELLAPSKVVIYDIAWQLIGTRDELAAKIADITKIDASYLTTDASDFANASIAEKMSWASTRQTKRVEDTAYCLLGIFDVNMPLLYGEGAKAFYRLQEEIMKQSNDQSIFTWSQTCDEKLGGHLLAPSPAHFENCGDLVWNVNTVDVKPYTMTNRGLHAEFPVLGRGREVIAVLNCRYANDIFCDIGIWLWRDSRGYYVRTSRPLQKIPITYWSRGRPQQMYVKATPGSQGLKRTFRRTAENNLPTLSSVTSRMSDESCVIRRLPKDYVVAEIYPPCPPLHGTSVKTSCVQVRALDPTTEPASRIMVLLTHQYLLSGDLKKNPAIVIIVYCRQELSRWVTDARLLPLQMDKDFDLATFHSSWEHQDLSGLQQFKSFPIGTFVLHVASRTIRRKRFTIIDVAFRSHRLRLAEEKMMQFSNLVFCSKVGTYFHDIRLEIGGFCILIFIYVFTWKIASKQFEQTENNESRISVMIPNGILIIRTVASLWGDQISNKDKLQDWIRSRHDSTLHVVKAVLRELPFLIVTSCYLSIFCIPSSFSWASTSFFIVAAALLVFFALQIYRWGNWI